MLHLRCGDDILGKLREAGLPGEFARWCDPLCDGPTPGGLPRDEWHRRRARFIADEYGAAYPEVLEQLRREDEILEGALRHDEVVLWFEHDLFDQAILLFLLDWFSRQPSRPPLTLVTLGAHPEVERFIGLGNLTPAQLARLFPGRRAVTPEQLALARRAWEAYAGPDPRAVAAFLSGGVLELPFLRDALRRHLQELPWTGDGLALTERRVLRAVERCAGDEGSVAFPDLFREVQRREAAPWQGDVMIWSVVRRLARARRPLLEIGGHGGATDFPSARVRLAPSGREVLAGRADAVALNGIDRWVGGLLLRGEESAWRWDEHRGTPVALN